MKMQETQDGGEPLNLHDIKTLPDAGLEELGFWNNKTFNCYDGMKIRKICKI